MNFVSNITKQRNSYTEVALLKCILKEARMQIYTGNTYYMHFKRFCFYTDPSTLYYIEFFTG